MVRQAILVGERDFESFSVRRAPPAKSLKSRVLLGAETGTGGLRAMFR